MILVRTVFQVKFGHMDAVLELIKEAAKRMEDSGRESRILTDASGQIFTLARRLRSHPHRREVAAGHLTPSLFVDPERLSVDFNSPGAETRR